MKTDNEIVFDALRCSLSAQVFAYQRNGCKRLYLKVHNRTSAGTPTFRHYRIELEPVEKVGDTY